MAASFGERFGNFIRGIPILGTIVRRLSRRSSTIPDPVKVNPLPIYSDIAFRISSAQLVPGKDYELNNPYGYIAEITDEINVDVAMPVVAKVKKPKSKRTKEERQKRREKRAVQFYKDVNRFTDVNSTLPKPSAARIAEIEKLKNTESPELALRLAIVDDFVEHVYNTAQATGKSNVNKDGIYAAVHCLQHELQGALFDVLGGCTFAKDGKQIPFQELGFLNNNVNDKVVPSQMSELPKNNVSLKLSIDGLKISYGYQQYMMHQDMENLDPEIVNRDILVTQVTTIDFGCLADGAGRGFKPGSDAITQTFSMKSLSNSVKFSLTPEIESIVPNVRDAKDSEYVVVEHPGVGVESEEFAKKPTPKASFFTWFWNNKSDAKAPDTVSDETNKPNHGNKM